MNGINPANNRPTDFIIGAAGGRRSTRCKRGGFNREPVAAAAMGGRRSTRGKRGGFNNERYLTVGGRRSPTMVSQW